MLINYNYNWRNRYKNYYLIWAGVLNLILDQPPCLFHGQYVNEAVVRVGTCRYWEGNTGNRAYGLPVGKSWKVMGNLFCGGGEVLHNSTEFKSLKNLLSLNLHVCIRPQWSQSQKVLLGMWTNCSVVLYGKQCWGHFRSFPVLVTTR